MRADTEPLADSLRRLLTTLDGGSPGELRRETSLVVFDFAVNGFALDDEQRGHLDHVLRNWLLRAELRPLVLDILGRASETGSSAQNEGLAFARAETVRAHLVTGGMNDGDLPRGRSAGARLPLEPAPGQEVALNRSVEVVFEWHIVPGPPPAQIGPGPGGGSLEDEWKIDLVTAVGGGKGIGGQVQAGTLTKRRTGERRPVTLELGGLDVGFSLPITAAASAGLDAFDDGEFDLPFGVGFDWFRNVPVVVWTITAAAIVGGIDATVLHIFFDGGHVRTRMASVPIGLAAGIGTSVMGGVINVV